MPTVIDQWRDVTADPLERPLTREERRAYERQADARKFYILKQIAYLQGRIEKPPVFVPCPVDPRRREK